MTRQHAALLKKARDSLRGAKLLVGDRLHDFAASRAYYTMLYVAEALLLGEGRSFSKHTAVIAAFGRRFARTETVPAEFHRFLIDGQDMRTIGDYSTGTGLAAAQAAEPIARHDFIVEQVLRALKRMRPWETAIGDTRAQLIGDVAPPDPDPVPDPLAPWASCGLWCVEGACKHVIHSRFERAGMRWEPPGFLTILTLRLARLNGTCQGFWASRGLASPASA